MNKGNANFFINFSIQIRSFWIINYHFRFVFLATYIFNNKSKIKGIRVMKFFLLTFQFK